MPGFDVVPLTPAIGAEVVGIDLTRPVPEDDQAALRRALLEHLVLFAREQDLTEEEQLCVASIFGPPVSASIDRSAGAEPLLFVTLEDSADDPPKADRWHTDVPFVDRPPDVAVLSMQCAPDVGGDTMWASLYEAYDRLSPAMQLMVEGLELDLDLGTSREVVRKMYGDEY